MSGDKVGQVPQRMLGNHGSNLTEEELEARTISAWKEGKSHLNRQINGSGRSYPRRLVHAGPYNSLKDVALKNLQNKVATVPIIHSSSQDGSFPQLLHLASLSGILKCICRHFRYSSGSLPILQQPIGSLPLGTWVPKIGESNGQQFAMLRPNPSLSSTLSLLVQGQEAPAETEPKFNPFTGSGRRLDGKPLNYQPPSVSSSSSGSKHKRPNVANGGGQRSSTGSTSQGTARETQGKLVFGRNVNHTKDPQKEAAKEPKQEQPPEERRTEVPAFYSEQAEHCFGNNIPMSKNSWRSCGKIHCVALDSCATLLST